MTILSRIVTKFNYSILNALWITGEFNALLKKAFSFYIPKLFSSSFFSVNSHVLCEITPLLWVILQVYKPYALPSSLPNFRVFLT